MSSGGWGNEEDWKKPADNPSNIIYRGPHRGVDRQKAEEDIRRIFGTPPPPNSKKPVPPPPLPPNSYHKKPKYWQMRHTSHAQPLNRAAFAMTIFFGAISYLIIKYSKAPDRWNERIGLRMTPEEKEEYDRKNMLYMGMLSSMPDDTFATGDYAATKYVNIRKADKNIRWDIRERDKKIVGTRDMGNPFDDAL